MFLPAETIMIDVTVTNETDIRKGTCMRVKRAEKNRLLFGLYIVILLVITLRPLIRPIHLFGGRVNAVLFEEYLPILYNGHLLRVLYLFLGNVIWFIPMGYYLVKRKELSFLQTVLFGFLISLLIETLQYVLGTGVSELDDLILNTFGCMTGALIALSLNRRYAAEV